MDHVVEVIGCVGHVEVMGYGLCGGDVGSVP